MAAKKEKPKPIEIVSAQRTRKTIVVHWKQGDGGFDLDERDNPLPAFGKAFDALAPLVPAIIGAHDGYSENLRVIGIKLGDQGGAPTVQFVCRKGLSDAAKEFPFTTPARLLAHPTQPGSYTPPLPEKQAALVWEAVEQVKAYVRGDRAQGQIEFEADDDEDDDDTESPENDSALLELSAPLAVPAKGKRGRKKADDKAAAAK